jgi:transposase
MRYFVKRKMGNFGKKVKLLPRFTGPKRSGKTRGRTFTTITKHYENILVQNFDLLNLPGWMVRSVQEEAAHLLIEAELEEVPFACPLCGSTKPLYRFGSRSRAIFDLPIRMKPVRLLAHRRRYRCRDCSGTFLDELPGIHPCHDATERLVRYIEVHALQLTGTFAGLGKTLGLSEKVVRTIFHAEIARLEQAYVIQPPHCLGIDEIYVEDHIYGVLTDIEHRYIVDLLAVKRDYLISCYPSNDFFRVCNSARSFSSACKEALL